MIYLKSDWVKRRKDIEIYSKIHNNVVTLKNIPIEYNLKTKESMVDIDDVIKAEKKLKK